MVGENDLDKSEGPTPLERLITPMNEEADALLASPTVIKAIPELDDGFSLNYDEPVQLAAAGDPMQPPTGDGAPRGVRGRPGGPPGGRDQPTPPPTNDTPAPPGRPGDAPTPPPPTDAVDRNSPAFKQALEAQKETADKVAAKILRGATPQLTGMGRAAVEFALRSTVDDGPVAMAALEQLVNQRIQAAARTNPALRDVEFKAQHSIRNAGVERTQNGEFSLIRKPPAGSPPGTKPEIDSMSLTGTKPPVITADPAPPQRRRGAK